LQERSNGREECISLNQVLRLYTINAQRLLENNHRKRLLKPGYIADIAVFKEDLFPVPPERFPAKKVAVAIVSGKVAFGNNPYTMESELPEQIISFMRRLP
jgi:predicted amidohydrolase YtcJ